MDRLYGIKSCVPALFQRLRGPSAWPYRRSSRSRISSNPARPAGGAGVNAKSSKSMASTTIRPDGTCIRDYIHVQDLARGAHPGVGSAGGRLQAASITSAAGSGYSVREVIDTARRVTRHPIPAVEAPKRAGDLPILVADSAKITDELGWEARFNSLERIIQTAWNWHRHHPRGYQS